MIGVLTCRAILAERATVAALARRRSPAPRRAVLLLVAGLMASLAGPSTAHAVFAASPCDATNLGCATLNVPLDASGVVGGIVPLNVRRLAARPVGTPTTDAVVALAGGPGQAAVPLTGSFAQALAPLLTDRDLLVFDQRGTGDSAPLRCDAFGAGGASDPGQVLACAHQLGAVRGLYRSIDSAQDIEALRVAGGYAKLVLYGVSYGTRVALTYAALHPDRVAALVLDSVVPLDGQDAFQAPSFAATPRVLSELCAADACRGITNNPTADLRRLRKRVERHTLRATIVDPDGNHARVRLNADGLWSIVIGGDLNPSLRADLPGAVRAALAGDPVAILRLRARVAGLSGAAASADDGVNDVLFTATRCEETVFPWDRDAGVAARRRQAEAATKALNPAAFVPFDPALALETSLMPLCIGWPDASPAPKPLPPLPNVPTLVLDGAADLRTPIAQAQRGVAGIPDAQVVSVPATGHSVLGSDLGTCAADALKAFAASAVIPACGAPDTTFSPSPVPPLRLSQLRGKTRIDRTLSAVRATIIDVKRQIVGDAIAASGDIRNGSRTGGLRGGVAIFADGLITLRKVVYVPGVTVSGFYALSSNTTGVTRLLVRGRSAARGSITIDARGDVAGTLGGHRINAKAAAAGLRPSSPELPRFANPALRAP